MGLYRGDLVKLPLPFRGGGGGMTTKLKLTRPLHPQLTQPWPSLELGLFSPFYWHGQQQQSRTLHFLSAPSPSLCGRRNGLQSQLQERGLRTTPTGRGFTGSVTSCFSASLGCSHLYFLALGSNCTREC